MGPFMRDFKNCGCVWLSEGSRGGVTTDNFLSLAIEDLLGWTILGTSKSCHKAFMRSLLDFTQHLSVWRHPNPKLLYTVRCEWDNN